MRWIHYSRFTGDGLALSADDLLRALSDYFLESGFYRQYMQFSEWNEHSLEELKRAIEQALRQGEAFSGEQAERIAEQLRKM